MEPSAQRAIGFRAFLLTPPGGKAIAAWINPAAFAYPAGDFGATGIINLARNIGGSVGIANVATLLARRAQVHQAMLVAHLTPYDAPYRSAAQGAQQMLMGQGSSAALAHVQAQGLLYGNLIRQANMLAYVDAFWLLGWTFIAMVPFMFLMKSAKPHAGATVASH